MNAGNRYELNDSQPKWMLWTGRVLSGLLSLVFLFSAFAKLSGNPQMVSQMTTTMGYPKGVILGLGIVELTCLMLYLVPQTAVLGAILLTGYLGGAIATHLRIGEPFIPQFIFGVIAWGGLFLRDERLRALIPLRKSSDNG